MRITEVLNSEKIREYVATALDTTVENTSEYMIMSAYPADFDHYHLTGTMLNHDSLEKIFQFNIFKEVGEKTIAIRINLTPHDVLKHWQGKNEAERVSSLKQLLQNEVERVNSFKQWLDVHVYNLVETAIYSIQQKEQEITGNE